MNFKHGLLLLFVYAFSSTALANSDTPTIKSYLGDASISPTPETTSHLMLHQALVELLTSNPYFNAIPNHITYPDFKDAYRTATWHEDVTNDGKKEHIASYEFDVVFYEDARNSFSKSDDPVKQAQPQNNYDGCGFVIKRKWHMFATFIVKNNDFYQWPLTELYFENEIIEDGSFPKIINESDLITVAPSIVKEPVKLTGLRNSYCGNIRKILVEDAFFAAHYNRTLFSFNRFWEDPKTMTRANWKLKNKSYKTYQSETQIKMRQQHLNGNTVKVYIDVPLPDAVPNETRAHLGYQLDVAFVENAKACGYKVNRTMTAFGAFISPSNWFNFSDLMKNIELFFSENATGRTFESRSIDTTPQLGLRSQACIIARDLLTRIGEFGAVESSIKLDPTGSRLTDDDVCLDSQYRTKDIRYYFYGTFNQASSLSDLISRHGFLEVGFERQKTQNKNDVFLNFMRSYQDTTPAKIDVESDGKKHPYGRSLWYEDAAGKNMTGYGRYLQIANQANDTFNYRYFSNDPVHGDALTGKCAN